MQIKRKISPKVRTLRNISPWNANIEKELILGLIEDSTRFLRLGEEKYMQALEDQDANKFKKALKKLRKVAKNIVLDKAEKLKGKKLNNREKGDILTTAAIINSKLSKKGETRESISDAIGLGIIDRLKPENIEKILVNNRINQKEARQEINGLLRAGSLFTELEYQYPIWKASKTILSDLSKIENKTIIDKKRESKFLGELGMNEEQINKILPCLETAKDKAKEVYNTKVKIINEMAGKNRNEIIQKLHEKEIALLTEHFKAISEANKIIDKKGLYSDVFYA